MTPGRACQLGLCHRSPHAGTQHRACLGPRGDLNTPNCFWATVLGEVPGTRYPPPPPPDNDFHSNPTANLLGPPLGPRSCCEMGWQTGTSWAGLPSPPFQGPGLSHSACARGVECASLEPTMWMAQLERGHGSACSCSGCSLQAHGQCSAFQPATLYSGKQKPAGSRSSKARMVGSWSASARSHASS